MYKNHIPIEYLKICKQCSKQYILNINKRVQYDNNDFCSGQCSKKHQQEREKKKCLNCGKELLNKRPTFCSEECNNIYNNIEEKIQITYCKNCNNQMINVHKQQMFCSKTCGSHYRNKNTPKKSTTSRSNNSTKSYGEQLLRDLTAEIFFDQHIEFGERYYDWLKYDHPLELDIYLPDINLAFEYDGEQHYTYTPHFHATKEDFYEQQRRDKYKNQKCNEKGVTLIRFRDKTEYVNVPTLMAKLKESNRNDLLSKYFNGLVKSPNDHL